MTVKEITEKLQLHIFSGTSGLNNEIIDGYVSDLLSDVMGNCDANNAWITLQTHKNIMAIASLKELACIIVVRNYQPDPDAIAKSNEDGIPILGTDKQSFHIAGELYELLHKQN
jgi:predicted transcriptional regulator